MIIAFQINKRIDYLFACKTKHFMYFLQSIYSLSHNEETKENIWKVSVGIHNSQTWINWWEFECLLACNEASFLVRRKCLSVHLVHRKMRDLSWNKKQIFDEIKSTDFVPSKSIWNLSEFFMNVADVWPNHANRSRKNTILQKNFTIN